MNRPQNENSQLRGREDPLEHTRLVWKVISKLPQSLVERVDRQDLFQAGMVAVCRAVKLHDAHKTHFSTYAWHAIYHALLDEIERHSVIYVPRFPKGQWDGYSWGDVVALQQQLDVAQEDHGLRVLTCHNDVAALEEQDEQQQLSQQVSKALQLLTPQSRWLVRQHFFRGRDFKSLALRLGVSVQRVRQQMAEIREQLGALLWFRKPRPRRK